MDPLKTQVNIPDYAIELNYDDSVYLAGSCFGQQVANKLKKYCFKQSYSPFGIVYHPIPLANGLKRLIQGITYSESELKYFDELWYSFDHHGSYNNRDRVFCLEYINREFSNASAFLKNSSLMILTFGSAIGFMHKQSGKIVANCHKLPGNQFEKRFFQPDEIVKMWDHVLNLVFESNARVNVLLTVSPVRHIRNGLVENQQSKASLLLAAHELARRYERVHYYPSYEIMLDELRDYRFYAEDMVHPSALAVDIIWERFRNTFITKSAQEIMKEINEISIASVHRPKFPESQATKDFVKNQLKRIEDFIKKHPRIDLTEYRERLKRKG